MNQHQGRAPNFTQACVFMFAVNLIWVLLAIWAVWGILAVIACGWIVNRAVSYLAARTD